ncbi:MAG: hypothetical protein K8F31_02885 [Roseovarius sp.]|nr:hypothetical protein [Roseovarius sp.]
MAVLFLILLLSLAGIAVALFLPGYGDLLLVAGPSALAALVLLLSAFALRKRRHGNWVLIDGSNVMHWKGGSPQVETLKDVIAKIAEQRLSPAVVFDANAGYLLAGKYKHHHAMAKMVGLSEDRVMVAPKGTPADSFLLMAARDFDAPIVTNDRYRDWAGEYPEIGQPGRLIRGGYSKGVLWLENIPARTHA